MFGCDVEVFVFEVGFVVFELIVDGCSHSSWPTRAASLRNIVNDVVGKNLIFRVFSGCLGCFDIHSACWLFGGVLS